METREQRGIIIAATVKLTQTHGVWVVPSQSGDKRYMVDPCKGTCTCPDHAETGFKCKHQYAVEFTVKRERHADGSVVEQQTFKWTERKTYSQDWPAYNAAQVHEKERFRVLLHDLCRPVHVPHSRTAGRQPTPACDAIFCAAFKVYSTVSTRRFMTDLRDAHEQGFISKPIHYNSIIHYLENPDYTPVLTDLIIRAATPLKAVESEFAVDSTGFSTSRFVRWYDEKYGVERSGHDWVKVHVMAGVKTHVVTSVEIRERTAHDAPLFGPLVKTTARNFKIKEISADKAYLSERNLEIALAVGAQPYIPFKVNSTPDRGGLWEQMYHLFALNNAAFMAAYHKRSNVESVFSMMKRKFGDHIRSRTDTAMRNEALCKILCHNICCVIGAMYETGLDPAFWAETGLAQHRS